MTACPSTIDAGQAEEPALRRALGLLTIDLDAIVENHRRLRDRFQGREVAAVVKADAYGLGAARVGPALAKAGVRCFFVACLEEALALRRALASLPDCRILVLCGPGEGEAAEYEAARLTPVLNTLPQAARWQRLAEHRGRPLEAALQVDTGMSRLGLSASELALWQERADLRRGIAIVCVMSHLACAETAEHPLNRQQLTAFRELRRRLPAPAYSLVNSSGIFLPADFHQDLARPGIALYGGNPLSALPNPMRQVVRLQGKILQIREIDAPSSVGYGATHQVTGRTRLATVGVGYADGYLRSLSNRASAWIGTQRLPLVGRVSMDLLTLDVSSLPAEGLREGDFVDLLGPGGIDALGKEAGSISYEILTSLGSRYGRLYRGG